MQEAPLLDGAAALEPDRPGMPADAAGDLLALGGGDGAAVAGGGGVVGAGRGGGQVRDVLGHGVLGADVGDANVGGFAGFAEGVVARVEVFAFLGRC